MTGDKVFLDTNIIVYAYDVSAAEKHEIAKKIVRDIVSDLLKWEVVVNDGESILEAAEILFQYGYSFWDSLIIAAAMKSGAEALLSENLAHGQTIDGVTIKNPFQTDS